jgi:hypothetical protein
MPPGTALAKRRIERSKLNLQSCQQKTEAKEGVTMAKRGPRISQFIFNCEPARDTEQDWAYLDAVEAGVASDAKPPAEIDLRADWWPVRHQGTTGACVGFAAADGVLRWLYVRAGLIGTDKLPSPRFIWMANKETDHYTTYPTTFIERAGTSTKLALRVARKYGCVLEDTLPWKKSLAQLSTNAFYSRAARLRISTYHSLVEPDGNKSLEYWRRWLANQGPILTRLDVDKTWAQATQTNGVLQQYVPDNRRRGHAVCLVGYTDSYFIVRNSWGPSWGDKGFAYAYDAYAQDAFTEAYGAIL